MTKRSIFRHPHRLIVSWWLRRRRKRPSRLESLETVNSDSNIGWDAIPRTIKTDHIYTWFDQATLMEMSLVSKQSNRDIRNGPNRIIPVLEISGLSYNKFLDKLSSEENIRSHYKVLKLKNMDKFYDTFGWLWYQEIMDKAVENMPKIVGVTSLDVSNQTSRDSSVVSLVGQIVRTLLPLLPNLHHIDLSNSYIERSFLFYNTIGKNCPRLEKITWNNVKDTLDSYMFSIIDGHEMESCEKLKEIYMDNTEFRSIFFRGDLSLHEKIGKMSDLDGNPTEYIFCNCMNVRFERVSIKNARYYTYGSQSQDYNGAVARIVPVPQNALIKFVRNAPVSLLWFRSDLSRANIQMLQKERPGIELVN